MLTEDIINPLLEELFATHGKGTALGIEKNRWNQNRIQYKKGNLSMGKKLEILNLAEMLTLHSPSALP